MSEGTLLASLRDCGLHGRFGREWQKSVRGRNRENLVIFHWLEVLSEYR